MNKNELWSGAVKDLSLGLPVHAINTWIDPIKAKEISKEVPRESPYPCPPHTHCPAFWKLLL